MKWPTPAEISRKMSVPKGFVLDTVSLNETHQLAALLGAWYPDIREGIEGCHLDPEFFLNQVTLKESKQEHSIYALVFRHNDRIAGFFSAERNERAKTVFGRLGVVDPCYRQSKLGNAGLASLVAVGECSEAVLVWGGATLKHSFSQQAYEAAGFQAVGIMPAADRDEVAPGKTRHVFEVLYAKVLISPEHLEIPREENMTPQVRRVWDTLFSI